MTNIQILLGYSGECSSSSCEAGQAIEYMKGILALKNWESQPEISSINLEKLADEVSRFEKNIQ